MKHLLESPNFQRQKIICFLFYTAIDLSEIKEYKIYLTKVFLLLVLLFFQINLYQVTICFQTRSLF